MKKNKGYVELEANNDDDERDFLSDLKTAEGLMPYGACIDHAKILRNFGWRAKGGINTIARIILGVRGQTWV
jgi:hypothetical protein